MYFEKKTPAFQKVFDFCDFFPRETTFLVTPQLIIPRPVISRLKVTIYFIKHKTTRFSRLCRKICTTNRDVNKRHQKSTKFHEERLLNCSLHCQLQHILFRYRNQQNKGSLFHQTTKQSINKLLLQDFDCIIFAH